MNTDRWIIAGVVTLVVLIVVLALYESAHCARWEPDGGQVCIATNRRGHCTMWRATNTCVEWKP